MEGERPREPEPESRHMSTTDLPQRKRPVHMPPVERHNAPVIVLVTLCVKPRRHVLANDEFHRVFLDAAQRADAWSVGYYVIMPDHIHAFCRPATIPAVSVKRWTSFLKRCLSERLSPRDWQWQTDCWDRQMRDQKHYEERYAYVRLNPARKGLVEDNEDWSYQGTVNVLNW